MVGSLVSTTGQHFDHPVWQPAGAGGRRPGQADRGRRRRQRLRLGLCDADLDGPAAAGAVPVDADRHHHRRRPANSTVSVGSLAPAGGAGQQFTATITAQSQLTSVDDFRNILLKTGEDGAAVRLGDVAEVESGRPSMAAIRASTA